MTWLGALRTNSCVAVASDSRACLSIPDPNAPGKFLAHPFDDASPKLAILADRIIIGFAGALTHPTVAESLTALVEHPAVVGAGADPLAVGNALAEALGTDPNLVLVVAFLEDGSQRPRVYSVKGGQFAPEDIDPNDRSKRPLCGLIPFSYGFTATDLIHRLDLETFPVSNYSPQKACDFVRWACQLALDVALFKPSDVSQFVAPPIVTAVVDHRGARWVTPPPPITARNFGIAAAA